MATTSISSITSSSFKYQIVGLGSAFTTAAYQRAGIASSQVVTDGGTTAPSGVIAYMNAPSSGTSINTPISAAVTGAVTGGKTYTVYGYVLTKAGQYYRCGSATFTTPIDKPSVPGQPVVSSRTSSSLSLSWTASTNSPTSYTLTYRRTGTSSWSYKPNITSNSTVLSGLTSGETYDLAVCALNSSGNSDYSTPIVMATTLPQAPLLFENSGLPYLVGQNFIDVPAVLPSGKYTAINVNIYTNSGSLITTIAVSSGGTATFTGLTADTPYKIKAQTRLYVNGTNIYSDWSYEHTIRTQPAVPTLPTPTLNTSLTTKTATSFSVVVNSVENAQTYYCYLHTATGTTPIRTLSSASRTFTFTGLSKNTTYRVRLKCTAVNYNDSELSGYYSVTTNDLAPWNWISNVSSNAAFKITPTEWLAFINRIDEVRVAYNIGLYGFTRTSTYFESGKLFYAWMFTQAANAIDEIPNITIPAALLNVASGDRMYASQFNDLKTALNTAITNL